MKQLTFMDDGKKVIEAEIPADLLPEAEMAREEMLEKICDFDDELMELALSGDEIPADLIHRAIRTGTIAHELQPVLCGSALDYIGVPPVLNSVARYLPSPADKPPVTGTGWKKKEQINVARKPNSKEPFCGLVFKIVAAKTGDLSFVRVYSGSMKANSRVLNVGKEKKENVAQLWRIQAAKKEQTDVVEAGRHCRHHWASAFGHWRYVV